SSLEEIRGELAKMNGSARDLISEVERMKIAQLNGKIDIASRPNAAAFTTLFEEVASIVGDARRDCDDIITLLADTTDNLGKLGPVEHGLRQELQRIGDATCEIVNGELNAATA
ncbi:MAG: hypothetical protein AAF266_14315, partial [Planctomycetota bacterium]